MAIWLEVLLALALLVAIGLLWEFLQKLFGTEDEAERKETNPKKGVDFIGVAAICFCHDGAGKYLVSKRSQNTRDEQGRWETGGGSIEFGEDIEEAMRREMQEEFGVDIHDIEFIGYRDVHRTLADGTKTHWVVVDYRARVDPAQVKIGEPDMIDEVQWVRLEDIPTPRHSQFAVFLEKYQNVL